MKSKSVLLLVGLGAGTFLLLVCGGLLVTGAALFLATRESTPNPLKSDKSAPGLASAVGKGAPRQNVLTLGQPLNLDGVQIEIKQINKLDLEGAKSLAIVFKITNNTQTEIIRYRCWHFTRAVSVKDEYGNSYPTSEFINPNHPFTKGEPVRIDPGQSLEDRVKIDMPQAACKELTITLQAANVSRAGTILCRVQRQQW